MENLDERDFERVRVLAEKLLLIPECPRSGVAVEALTEHLVRMCGSLDEAAWLADEALAQWDEWRGVKGLAFLLHMHRFSPLPDPNRAADAEQKARWLAEGAEYDPHWAEKLLKAAKGDAKAEAVEMHLKAIRDMLHYTEGEGHHESRDSFWHDARRYDLAQHPELVEWVRGGEVGPMPSLEPLSRRKPPRAVPGVDRRPITSEDVELELERQGRKSKPTP